MEVPERYGMRSKGETPALVEVKNLNVRYPIRGGVLGRVKGYVEAVKDASIFVRAGETLGLVGESGSGKSTLGKAIVKLLRPTSGDVLLEGESIFGPHGYKQRVFRRQVQMVFQDPYYSLNPRKTVGATLSEVLKVHRIASGTEATKLAQNLFLQVGLQPDQLSNYPHEFSGGQRQRIGIARALALKPKVIVADEPVSALDVSVQAQIINLFLDLQEQYGLSYIFITHDLGVVSQLCHRVAVMREGKIVEQAERRELFRSPENDYTKRLLAAVPDIKSYQNVS